MGTIYKSCVVLPPFRFAWNWFSCWNTVTKLHHFGAIRHTHTQLRCVCVCVWIVYAQDWLISPWKGSFHLKYIYFASIAKTLYFPYFRFVDWKSSYLCSKRGGCIVSFRFLYALIQVQLLHFWWKFSSIKSNSISILSREKLLYSNFSPWMVVLVVRKCSFRPSSSSSFTFSLRFSFSQLFFWDFSVVYTMVVETFSQTVKNQHTNTIERLILASEWCPKRFVNSHDFVFVYFLSHNGIVYLCFTLTLTKIRSRQMTGFKIQ